MRTRGQQLKYTRDIADEICERLAEGESLDSICRDAHMPAAPTVRLWAAGHGKAPLTFVAEYARARSVGYEKMAEEVIAIGDGDFRLPDGTVDNAAVQAARLQCDNRKWLLSKMLPKQFGDKVTQEITGDPDAPLVTRIELVPVASSLPSPVRKLTPPTIDEER